MKTKKTYRDDFDADTQITAEEQIASLIFDRLEIAGCENGDTLTQEDCADLGRAILKQVLAEFRPDLFGGTPPNLQTEMLSVLRNTEGELTDMADSADSENEHWSKGGSAYELLQQVRTIIRKAEVR